MVLDLTLDLFVWWAISISWSILFLIVAAIYLYSSGRSKHEENRQKETEQRLDNNNSIGHRPKKTPLRTTAGRIVKDFVFVWFLLGLLVFYIFSVRLGSGTLTEAVFALGNIVVEVLLVFYLVRNRDKNHKG